MTTERAPRFDDLKLVSNDFYDDDAEQIQVAVIGVAGVEERETSCQAYSR